VDLERAAADADAPVLLVAVAHHTGDLSILKPEFRPDTSNLFDPNAGLSLETQAEMRELAVATLRAHGDAPSAVVSRAALRQMIAFLVGDEPVEAYEELLIEELGLEGMDLRAPTWTVEEIAPGQSFEVAIIGAGMSGLAAAYRLIQAGVDVTIFEKNADVGGTWFENVYPGCRVDVANHLYSYSFFQTTDWPEFFSAQQALLDYFRHAADSLDLRKHIRFSTEVVSATWDEDTERWDLLMRGPDGELTHRANAVCSAVGQLNRPKFPDIPGQDTFEGPSFHSARWDYDVDIEGKKVAVIGTGASAAQFIPWVAERAGELVVYQRTPPWLAPTPNYHDALPDGLREIMAILPNYVRWDRLWLFWRTHEGLLPAAKVDPDWQAMDRSVSTANDFVREFLTMYIKGEFPDEKLFQKVLPTYPPIAKRIIRDNGVWGRSLSRPNVEVVTERIAEITEHGVVTADGVERPADVIVYGTGFYASRFLMPMRVVGRGGKDLHDEWGGDARAYLGMTVPNFPNLFMMYGPNTNIVINGSIIYFSECEAHYIVESVRMLLEQGVKSMDVRPEIYDEYTSAIDEANRSMAWGASTVNTWYKNDQGKITQNWPYSLLEYWERTREVNPKDYVLR
jgi:4-hydroxyacetophenone monooxygenase